MHRSVKPLAIIIVVLLAVAIATGYLYNRQPVVVPHIVAGATHSAPIMATHTFSFEKSQITISVPVDADVYSGAKSTDKSVSIYGNISENTWVSASYLSMINDAAQDPLYSDLITRFREIRDDQKLSSDEYLELMAAYTQSLTYETTPDNPAKYPIETVVDGTGDCDDKSLLLAGLLSHEGYNVSLLSFSPEAHMALGIGSAEPQFRDTGYTYLETTNLSYVGVLPDDFKDGITLTSEPLVIPVGSGSTGYNSGAETAYLHNISTRSKQNVLDLETRIKPLALNLTAEQNQISRLESQMQALQSSGNIGAYNAQVSTHNALVAAYNSERAIYRQLVARYDTWANIHNYIISHAYDRKGTYDWVMANVPA